MSDNALSIFDPAQLPTHIGNFFNAGESNITEKQTVPSLSYEGKIWSISLDGTKTKLMRRNADGDEEPISTMRVVVLDYAKRRGRQYYAGNYDPNNISPPVCWSDDGIAPDASLPPVGTPVDVGKPVRQSTSCDTCPLAVKGSKMVDGKAVTACSQHRMLAVVPAHKLDFEPLRLKIAITSDWDAQSPNEEAAGWRAFSKYTDFLKSRGVQHTAAVVTKIKFDSSTSYPKLFFAPDRWLEPGELEVVSPLTRDDRVQKLLGGTFTPNGVDGTAKPSESAQIAQTAQEAPAQVQVTQVAAIVEEASEPAQPAAEVIIEATPAATATPAPTQSSPASAANASATVDPAIAALLSEWGD